MPKKRTAAPATPDYLDYSRLGTPDFPFAKLILEELKGLKLPIRSVWEACAPDSEDNIELLENYSIVIGSSMDSYVDGVHAVLFKDRKEVKRWYGLGKGEAKRVAEFTAAKMTGGK